MTPFEIEAWALRVVDQTTRGATSEDSRVELKAEWPRSTQAARQLAGHANAARGAQLLWLIGLDEQRGVLGAPAEELANWYSEIKACFDGVAPDLYDLNVPVNGKTVVALLFHTDRAPFVVKNATYGQPGGGSVELEVPWREGRKTRSATRGDLIRLLEPVSLQPSIEVLGCEVTVNEAKTKDGDTLYHWFVYSHLYITPVHAEAVVIPFHRCTLSISGDTSWVLKDWDSLDLKPPSRFHFSGGKGFGTKVDSLTIAASGSEVIVEGPGRMSLHADVFFDPGIDVRRQTLRLTARLLPVGGRAPVIIDALLPPTQVDEKHFAQWKSAETAV